LHRVYLGGYNESAALVFDVAYSEVFGCLFYL
jgi:hypothetical protein